MAMTDTCHFNHNGYCMIDRHYPNLPDCEYRKDGFCDATADDLVTEEEYWEMNRSGR